MEKIPELELKLSSLTKRLEELEKRLELLERKQFHPSPPPGPQETEKPKNEKQWGYLSKTIAAAKREYQKTL
ncbi:MAG: hypothetical protein QXM46_05035 [Candidatus Hadarchaeales archaeon]